MLCVYIFIYIHTYTYKYYRKRKRTDKTGAIFVLLKKLYKKEVGKQKNKMKRKKEKKRIKKIFFKRMNNYFSAAVYFNISTNQYRFKFYKQSNYYSIHRKGTFQFYLYN